MENPADMPAEWRKLADNRDAASAARIIADYIAGMTDNYALKCHDAYFKVDARV
jgi:dGTPase